MLSSELLNDFAEGAQILAHDGLIDPISELLDAAVIHRFHSWQLHQRDRLTGSLFDGTQQVLLTRGHEKNRIARTTGTTGTANAVHIGLGVVWDVVVDDVADALHVQATSGHVGGNEDIDFARAQILHGTLTLLLWDVTIDSCRGEAASLELIGQIFGGHLGAHEGDHTIEFLGFEDTGHGV